jgi:hypothetical protein
VQFSRLLVPSTPPLEVDVNMSPFVNSLRAAAKGEQIYSKYQRRFKPPKEGTIIAYKTCRRRFIEDGLADGARKRSGQNAKLNEICCLVALIQRGRARLRQVSGGRLMCEMHLLMNMLLLLLLLLLKNMLLGLLRVRLLHFLRQLNH